MSFSSASTNPNLQVHDTLRAVILDYGRVLCHSPQDVYIKRFADTFGLTQQQFWAAFERHRPQYDEGLCSCEEFWHNMAQDTANKPTAEIIAQLAKWDVEMWSCFEPAMLRWVDALRDAGYKTALLSNAPLDFATHARREFEWLGGFDVSIFSAEINLVKPGPAIFQHCLDQLGVKAQESLFIDDVAENIEGARSCGLNAIRFQSAAQLAADLSQIGFEPLPLVI